MNVLGTLGTYVSSALDFNKATLSGALDIIAMKNDDGSMVCTPFHVRFGKLKLFRSRDKIIKITCNGQPTDLVMRLSEAGEAYFIHLKHREDDVLAEDESSRVGGISHHPPLNSPSSTAGLVVRDTNNQTVQRPGTTTASTISDIEPSLSASSRSLSPPLYRSRIPYDNNDYDSISSRQQKSTAMNYSTKNTISINSVSPLPVTIDHNDNIGTKKSNIIASLPQLQIDGTVTIDGQTIGRVENFPTLPTTTVSTTSKKLVITGKERTIEQATEVTERLLAAAVKIDAPNKELPSTPLSAVAATLAQQVSTTNYNDDIILPRINTMDLSTIDTQSTPAITPSQSRRKKKYIPHTLTHRAYIRPLSGSLSEGEIDTLRTDKLTSLPLRKYTNRLITVQRWIIQTTNHRHNNKSSSSHRHHPHTSTESSYAVVPKMYNRQRKGSMDQPFLNLPQTTHVSSELSKEKTSIIPSSTARTHHRRKGKRSTNREPRGENRTEDNRSTVTTAVTSKIDLRGMRPEEYAELKAFPPQVDGLPPISPNSAMHATLNVEREVPFSEALLFAAEIESAKRHDAQQQSLQQQDSNANTTDDYDVSNPSSPPLSSQSTRKKNKSKRSGSSTKQRSTNKTETTSATPVGVTMNALEELTAGLTIGNSAVSSSAVSLSKTRSMPNKFDLPPIATNFDNHTKDVYSTSTTALPPKDLGTPGKKKVPTDRPSTISLARRQRRRGTSPGRKPGMFSSVFSFLRGESRYIPDLSDNDSDNLNIRGDTKDTTTEETVPNDPVSATSAQTPVMHTMINEVNEHHGTDILNKTIAQREIQIEHFKHSSEKLNKRMELSSTRKVSSSSAINVDRNNTGSVSSPITQGISIPKEPDNVPVSTNHRPRRHSGIVAPLTHLYMPEKDDEKSSKLLHHSRKNLSTNFSSAAQVIAPPWHDSKRFQRSGSTVDDTNINKDFQKMQQSKVSSGTLSPNSTFTTPTFPGQDNINSSHYVSKITLNNKDDTVVPEKSRMRWLNNLFSNSTETVRTATENSRDNPLSSAVLPSEPIVEPTISTKLVPLSGTLLRGALPRQNWFAHEALDGEEMHLSQVPVESGTSSPVKLLNSHSGSSSMDHSFSPVRKGTAMQSSDSSLVEENGFFEEIKRKLFYSDSFFLHMGHIITDAVHANEYVFVNVLETVLLPHLSLEQTYHLPLSTDDASITGTGKLWYAPKRCNKAGFITQRARYGTEFSSILPRALVRAGSIHPNSLLHEETKRNSRRRLHRSASFDISSMTNMQRTICYDAFALWAIEMTTTNDASSLNTHGTISLPSDPNPSLASLANHNHSMDKNTDGIPRRISKREKYLGWIPVIGPLVIPNSNSNTETTKSTTTNGTTGASLPSVASSIASSHNNTNDDDSSSTVSTINNSFSLTDGEEDNHRHDHRRKSVDPVSFSTEFKEGRSSSSYETDASSIEENRTNKSKDFQFIHHHYPSRFVRSLVPSSDQLATLPLVDGANILTFEVEGSGVSVTSSLYLWSPHAKIVISDVDGTITKSDVLGHIFYFVGRDWTHAGVAQLYSNIKANGYNIVYLTSRAIGQTDATKGYLQNIKQMEVADTRSEVTVSTGNNSTAITKQTTDSSTSVTSNTTTPIKGGITTVTSSTVNSSTTTTITLTNSADESTKSLVNSLPDTGNTANTVTSVSSSSSATASTNSTVNTVNNPSVLSTVSLSTSSSGSTKPVYQLPPGPVITSPDRLFTAFAREVIMRRPQEFKIAALRDIQRLFPPGINPFYAGFGNRDTDILAYRTVGISDGKIFIINPEGEIRQMNTTYRKTYGGMNKLIQEMFPLCRSLAIDTPGIGSRNGKPISTPDAYNDINYWRTPLASLTLSDEEDAKKSRSTVPSKSVPKTK